MRHIGFNSFKEFNHFVPRGLSPAPPHVLCFTPVCWLIDCIRPSLQQPIRKSGSINFSNTYLHLFRQHGCRMKKSLDFWLKSDICWFEIKACNVRRQWTKTVDRCHPVLLIEFIGSRIYSIYLRIRSPNYFCVSKNPTEIKGVIASELG